MYKRQPYEGVYENGVIYGRGAVDDKGPAISAIYALAALKRAGAAFRRTPRIISVSYTHLDVYKRQVMPCSSNAFLEKRLYS